jgi:flagellin
MSFGDINRVNTNIQALNARNALNNINDKLSDTQQKLSTGKRINKAEDDSAGFSIASKLSAKIGGLEQASQNASDGKSMLDVAESRMDSIKDILTTMKSKAVQGASDSVGSEERGYIANQLNDLMDQVDNVVGQTKFQGHELLGGGAAANTGFTFQVGDGTGSADSVTVKLNSLEATASSGGLSLTKFATGSGGIDGSNFTAFMSSVDSAISTLNGEYNKLGIDQKSLTLHQDNLQQSITSNKSARSNIEDSDFAKLQSQSIKLQIEQQTATSAFAQANSSSQAVLSFLGNG